MKRSKLLNIACSITVSVLFILILLLGLILGGVLSVNTNKLVLKSDSAQSVYSGVPLTSENWQIASGELKEGHTVEVSFSGVQTYAGQSPNTFYAVIRDSFGMDVTSTYDLILEYGTLEVVPKPLKVVSGNAQKMYDGEPLTCPDWSYYPQNALLSNSSIEVEVVGSLTEVGFAANTIGSVAIYNESGKDVTGNYEITLEYGILTVLGLGPDGLGGLGGLLGMINQSGMLDLSGNISGNELDGSGEDVICYEVYNKEDDKVYLKLKSFGDYGGGSWKGAVAYPKTIGSEFSADYLMGSAHEKTHSTLKIRSLNGQYALPYYMRRTYSSGYEIQSSDVLYSGNTDGEYSVYYSRFDASKTYTLPDTLLDYEQEYRNFVYDQYLHLDDETRAYMEDIIAAEGFTGDVVDIIFDIASYIKNSASYNPEYDRALDDEENVAIAFLEEYQEGICQHYATAATLLYRAMGIPARYTVGFVCDTVSGEWVDVTAKSAHAWVEVYLDGLGWMMVEVTGSFDGPNGTGGSGGSGGTGGSGGSGGDAKLKVTLRPKNEEKLYDGTDLLATPEITGFDKYYNLGYSIDVKVEGSRIDPGKGASYITEYIIYDPDGNEANDLFDVTLKEGTLHVYLSELTFSSESISKVYDGETIQTDISQCYLVGGELKFMEEAVSFASNASITDAGARLADFKVFITYMGQDITDYYKITKDCGILTVTHRSITIKADDATKVYDGEPLISDSFTITDGELVDGHSVSNCIIKIEQERIGVGRSQCIPSDVVICNSNGEDVTKNYSIKYEEGTLRVLPA